MILRFSRWIVKEEARFDAYQGKHPVVAELDRENAGDPLINSKRCESEIAEPQKRRKQKA